MEASDEARPVSVIEYVEQATVQHGVVLLVTRLEVESVAHLKSRIKISLPGFCLGELDGLGRRVDPGGIETGMGGHQRVFARTASDVEDSADHNT
jgi:hypothetical protein